MNINSLEALEIRFRGLFPNIFWFRTVIRIRSTDRVPT